MHAAAIKATSRVFILHLLLLFSSLQTENKVPRQVWSGGPKGCCRTEVELIQRRMQWDVSCLKSRIPPVPAPASWDEPQVLWQVHDWHLEERLLGSRIQF